ncbi:hypothetical protein ACFQ48_12970 [Hymenobacter caeli]|uniref:DUF3471 domain-containing protein n=1 Tax=Hymenobacter caeli TaxID=2735894 RepID=A0ABX2FSZ7_9BACT|nr:hypothetical protein [Hymenobacter caeli]NRT20249.1 hypothetical protein [Hymenobacter caeli]
MFLCPLPYPRCLLAALLLPGPAPGPPAAFFATYRYTAYTVYDHTTDAPPTRVPGVGGTLALRPDGTYDKRLSLLMGDSGPRLFAQHGRFATQGDSIRFLFTDAKGPDVQRGTYRYDARTRRLTIAIAGYPPGNRGVYELVAGAPPARRK